jgi:hypothetical protein
MEAQAGQGVPDMERFREEQLESEWRRKAVDKLLTVFYRINYLVVGLLLIFWIVETLVPHAPQVITERTMLTLIGASAVQLGALAGFVGKSLATRS